LCCGVTTLGGAAEIANRSRISLFGSHLVEGGRILRIGHRVKDGDQFSLRKAFAAEVVQLGTSQVDLFACRLGGSLVVSL
jgi:hypothetical protein